MRGLLQSEFFKQCSLQLKTRAFVSVNDAAKLGQGKGPVHDNDDNNSDSESPLCFTARGLDVL